MDQLRIRDADAERPTTAAPDLDRDAHAQVEAQCRRLVKERMALRTILEAKIQSLVGSLSTSLQALNEVSFSEGGAKPVTCVMQPGRACHCV